MSLSPEKQRNKQIGSILLRFGVTVLLLILIGRSIDWPEIISLFQNMHYGWLLGACVAMLIVRYLMALRWQYVLVSEGINKPLKSLTKIIFVSQFIGHLLPGSVGIEAVRGYEIVRDHGKIANVTATLLIDRVIGIYAMMLLALFGAILAEYIGISTGLLMPTIVLTIVAVIGWVAMMPLAPKLINLRPFNHPTYKKIWSKLMLILTSLTSTEKLKHYFVPMFVVSFLVQIARCVIFYSLYRTLGATTAFTNFMIFVPLVFVALLLPVSIGGLGVREGTLVYFFSTVGIATEISVGVGILSHFLQIALSVPAMLVWVFERRGRTVRPVDIENQIDLPSAG